ncbi:CHAP domain-containing protein [Aquimarina algicola]|uniref:CHAP domain-containing protein n=1 Tax=Aquimarina algicola TaxID=2589995 RepID=A0A504JGV6_9FLAO|nr:CHAP domain-containing protein [Aquimarina algicola]TPN86903.1 CHAP domain-containing protein [Aquimarina algicola]
MIKKTLIIIGVITIAFLVYKGLKRVNFNSDYEVGQKIDSLNGVAVYYNGGVDNVVQRNTKDGYNLGLEYQCVEFVKRYYFEYYNHKMPDSYGHAKSFYDKNFGDGEINTKRDLTQYSNPSGSKPRESDLIVMSGTILNTYGHVAIIAKVTDRKIEIIQQNPGPFSPSRETFELIKTKDDTWKINDDRVLGWLRKQSNEK